MGSERLNLSRGLQMKRDLAAHIASPFLPQEINPIVPEGLPRARELVHQGYGLIVAFNHFSFRDALDIMEFIIEQPVIGERPITSPMARHQFDAFKAVVRPLTYLASIDMYSVVEKDTKKHKKYQNVPLGEGMFDYLKAGVRSLEVGGIVPIALQTGRRASLYEDEPEKSLSSIMAGAKKRKLNKYAVLFVGLGRPGVEDYSREIKKFNFFKTYRINTGNVFTAEEIHNQVGDSHEIDKFAYKQLELVVPEAYLKKATLTPPLPGV